jgi:hypothetical protein
MKTAWLRAAIVGLLLGPAAPVADVGAEPVEPEDSSAESPEGLAEEVTASTEDEESEAAVGWAVDQLTAGGILTDPLRWRDLAEQSAAQPPLLTDDLEAELAAWAESAPGDSGISPLGGILCLLPSLDRTVVVATWATSSDEATRRALARALAAPFDAVGVRGALEQLQADPSPEIRRLARSAAVSRKPVT